MSEAADSKSNGEITVALDKVIKDQIHATEDVEHVSNECDNHKNVDISKNVKQHMHYIDKHKKVKKNKNKHKRKKLTDIEKGIQNAELEVSKNEAAVEELEQIGKNLQDPTENHEQIIKAASSRSKKKSKDVAFESENEEQKPKPKRKSRLSLNSEVKSKNKFKEDCNQGTLISFFQKLSPRTEDNKNSHNANIEEESNCSVEELEENWLVKMNHVIDQEDAELVCTKNRKEKTPNKLTLVKGNQKLIKENEEANDGHADKNMRRKKKSLEPPEGQNSSKNSRNKNKLEEKTTRTKTTKKEKILSSTSISGIKGLINSSNVEKLVDSINGENNAEKEIPSDGDTQNEDSNNKEPKKVRFSEHIKEFSPEPIRKHSKFNEKLKEELKYDENKKQPVDDQEVINEVNAIAIIQATEIKNDDENSRNLEGKPENIVKNINEQMTSKIRNAFTFMMDSRHKSIGQNSPGKEQEKLEETPELHKENKKKLSSRKAIFEEWANAKGAKKRKLEEEEKGIIIENKLKKRAKRLKKMLIKRDSLHISSAEDIQDNSEFSGKKHKVTRIILSNSEPTCDSVKESEDLNNVSTPCSKEPKKGKRKRKSGSEEKNLQQENDVIPVDDDALDEEIFVERKKPKPSIISDSSNSECNVIYEDKQKSDSNESLPCASLQQTELSSFFGILNKTEKFEAAIKSKSKLRMKRNNCESKFRTQKSKKQKNNVKSKLTLKKNDASNATVTSDNSVLEIDSENGMESEEERLDLESEIRSDIVQERMKKALAVLTPSSINQWKMKLKVTLANVADEEIEQMVQSPRMKTESEDDSNDVQEMRKKINKALVISESDSDDEPLSCKKYYNKNLEKDESKNMKPIKLAPLFIKAKPKPKPPKLDKATIEARRRFLHSGIPDSLKKTIEKQQRVEELDFQIFPTVSHITVKPTNEQLANSLINFWALPKVELQLASHELYSPNISFLNQGAVTSSTAVKNTEINLQAVQKVMNVKNHLQQIKAENPNYPVYKAFKILHQKHVKNNTNEIKVPEITKSENINIKRKRGRPKRKKSPPDEVQIETAPIQPINISNEEIWTDLYKPNTSEEIFGNYASISQFKTWLETWLEFSEEINMQKSRRRRRHSDSSDFESTDADSKNSTTLPGNTIIFCGPHGSGKTMAVYALCNELGVNVLELNASSKRTGKRLLQELQEATRSHQVRKNDLNPLTTFLNKEDTQTPSQNSHSSDSQSSTSSKKMCLLLIEDVDIVFEQDENFITALSQLLSTSKRPVVLTTTDINCLHLKKFVLQHPVITFSTLSAKILATWFQVLCLIEGLHVDRQTIVDLLEWNKGDVRRTLLQLQFWVQSGGQLKISEESSLQTTKALKRLSCDENLSKDDSCDIAWLNNEEGAIEQQTASVVHSNCLESFGYFNKFKDVFTLLPVNLGDTWWNIANLLNIPSPLRCRSKVVTMDFKNEKEEDKVEEEKSTQSNLDSQSVVKQDEAVVSKTKSKDLQNIVNIFETLAMTDTIYEKLNIDCDTEPVHTRRDNRVVKNSLELNECMESYSSSRTLAYEWSHALLDGYINLYDVDQSIVKDEDRSVSKGKRWRTKQNKCDEALLEAVPVVCHLDYNSVNMDYLSTLRTMARSEVVRASNNNKRRNRFYNYLRGIGISCNDSLFQTACNTFQHAN